MRRAGSADPDLPAARLSLSRHSRRGYLQPPFLAELKFALRPASPNPQGIVIDTIA